MKAKRFLSLLFGVCAAALLLAGCAPKEPAAQPSPPPASSDGPASSPAGTPDESERSETEPPSQGQTATLYVGTKENGFSEYPLDYEGELTPEILIQGIADLTGWDLSLAEEVTSGKGGMSVCLSGESSLFAGPPDPQKDEFHMFDGVQLAQTILDSIQKTLQEGSTGAGGNPDALEVYYFMAGERPLELPDIGRAWPMDQPYTWEAGEAN